MKKIFITGCAKSGTTLFKDLLRSFDSAFVIEEELSVSSFCRLRPSQVGEFDYVVGKRSWDSIYSCGRLRSTDIKNQYLQLQRNNVIVINVIRDGRNVVRSLENDWGWYNPFEWMECVRQQKEHGGVIGLTVRFEDLLKDPDSIQEKVKRLTGMNNIYKFSEYPTFIETTEEREKNYTFRPFDASRAIPDKETYLKSPNDIEHFNKLLLDLGYK